MAYPLLTLIISEQMRAIMEAASQVNAPVIVQASAGARKYAGAPFCVI